MGIQPFQTVFAVPMHCESCVQDVSRALNELDGTTKVDVNLKDQLVVVEGTAAPSSLVLAIESTGRDAILRGSGKANTAGVCILETFAEVANPVRGLLRMVEVSNNVTLVDMSVRGVSPGTYHATVRQTGDISSGAQSTGGIWEAITSQVKAIGGFGQPRGIFGTIEVDNDGRGSTFLDRPVSISELIGRAVVVSKEQTGPFKKEDPNTLVGVVARSAGVWANDKIICSCSGKTVFEERQEQMKRGMI